VGHSAFLLPPRTRPDGNCRMCQVEIVTPRGAVLAISCNTQGDGRDGCGKRTATRVKRVRAAVPRSFSFLEPMRSTARLRQGGECTLQNYYTWGTIRKDGRRTFVRVKKLKRRTSTDARPRPERCVLCDRCVRFLRNWAGEEQLYIAGAPRGVLNHLPGKGSDDARIR